MICLSFREDKNEVNITISNVMIETTPSSTENVTIVTTTPKYVSRAQPPKKKNNKTKVWLKKQIKRQLT